MSTGDQVNRIRKYIGQLKNEDKISHALSRLDKIDMTVALLTETGVGKEVNRLKNHPELGQKAQKIVDKWRKLASEQSSSVAASNNHASSNNNNGKLDRKRPAAADDGEEEGLEELRSNQNISFADALKAPKVPPKKIRVIIKEPEAPKEIVIPESYFPRYVPPPPVVKKEEPEVDPAQFSARKGKPMKIYAGRKQTKFVKKVDTLYNLAMTACMQNIDNFTHGPLPTVYQVFHPVLARCTPEQLDRIESHNPHFEEDSDALWQTICVKAFPKAPNNKYEDEPWKHCYKRLIQEREEKLRQISNKIKKENKSDQLTTKMADAVTPGNVLQRQIKNGTFCRTGQVPHAIEVAKARRGIFNNGTKAGMAAIPAAMRLGGVGPSAPSSSKASSSSAANPPKKGALMQKTLRMMKSRSKR